MASVDNNYEYILIQEEALIQTMQSILYLATAEKILGFDFLKP
jgi:hypothetical protein